MKHHLSIDLETYSSVPIGKSGAYKYVQSPDFEILLFAYSVDDGPVEIVDLAQGEFLPDWLYKAVESPEYIKHAYNAAFEWYCLSKFYGHLLPADQWRDTMLHGLYCGYTAGLDATGKALGLPAEKQKLSVGKALIRYFCVPCAPTQSNGGRRRNLPKHDPDKWNLFKTYCIGDVTTEKEIERRLSAFPVPDDIEKQWQTDLAINARGVAVDMEMVRGALEIGAASRDRLMQEAVSITGLENPNSIAQLSQWLEKATDTPVTDLRKDTVATMLESQAVTGSAGRMLEIRQELGKTSTKKYDAIEAAVCADGRVRGLLQFYGANRTGRWAGRLVQVQNLPRTYIGQLPLARQAVKDRQEDKLKYLYAPCLIPCPSSSARRSWRPKATSWWTPTSAPSKLASSRGSRESSGGWKCSEPTAKSTRRRRARCSASRWKKLRRATPNMPCGKRARSLNWRWVIREAPVRSSQWAL